MLVLVSLLKGIKIELNGNLVLLEYKKATYEIEYKDDMKADLMVIMGLDYNNAIIINKRIQAKKEAQNRASID